MDPAKEIEILAEREEVISAIKIAGDIGFGKTTLDDKVHTDPDVKTMAKGRKKQGSDEAIVSAYYHMMVAANLLVMQMRMSPTRSPWPAATIAPSKAAAKGAAAMQSMQQIVVYKNDVPETPTLLTAAETNDWIHNVFCWQMLAELMGPTMRFIKFCKPLIFLCCQSVPMIAAVSLFVRFLSALAYLGERPDQIFSMFSDLMVTIRAICSWGDIMQTQNVTDSFSTSAHVARAATSFQWLLLGPVLVYFCRR